MRSVCHPSGVDFQGSLPEFKPAQTQTTAHIRRFFGAVQTGNRGVLFAESPLVQKARIDLATLASRGPSCGTHVTTHLHRRA